MAKQLIWIIDDDPGIRYVLEEYLKSQHLEVCAFKTGAALLDAFQSVSMDHKPSVVMADIRLDGESGLDLMHALRAQDPELPVIIMTAYSDLDNAVGAFQGGAFEFLAKPFDLAEVKRLIDKAGQKKPQSNADKDPDVGLIGQSTALQDLIRTLGRLSNTDIPVLITGETGVGKELIARALHANSPNSAGPFIAINMAAIPDDLLESELFGHERGAFPGADQRRIGRFEQAATGTLFLDEIGDMPLRLQTRLLRVLAEGEYYRLGGHDLIQANARIVTATNQNLEQLVDKGLFRADLYHRLRVIALNVPPLRDRRDDIPKLITHFLDLAATEFKVAAKSASPQVIDHLVDLDWPGNVRELKNLCQSLAVLAPGETIGLDDLPAEYQRSLSSGQTPKRWANDWAKSLAQHIMDGDRNDELFIHYKSIFERVLAQTVLTQCKGNQSQAAKRLGISRNTLARFLNPSKESGR